jgi:hypothetical protein
LRNNLTISLGLESTGHVGRWWCRGGDVMVIPSHPPPRRSTRQGGGAASGGCLPHAPRVSPSSPPDPATTLSPRHAGHATAWPTDQRDRDRSSALRSGSSSCLTVGPALVPFLLPLSSPPCLSILPSNRRKGRAEPSPQIWPLSLILTSIRGSFGKVRVVLP